MQDRHKRLSLNDFGKLIYIILATYLQNKALGPQSTQLHIDQIEGLQTDLQKVFQHTLANLLEHNKFFNLLLDTHITLGYTLLYKYDLHGFPSILLNSYLHSFP